MKLAAASGNNFEDWC